MAKLKTLENNADVVNFIKSVENEQRRSDSLMLLEIFKGITELEPKMWGTSIVGFGKYHYKSQRSIQEGDWPLIGFSPRKQNLTLYVINGNKKEKTLLDQLGKHKVSVGCLYINKLSDVDLSVLKKIIKASFEHSKSTLDVI